MNSVNYRIAVTAIIIGSIIRFLAPDIGGGSGYEVRQSILWIVCLSFNFFFYLTLYLKHSRSPDDQRLNKIVDMTTIPFCSKPIVILSLLLLSISALSLILGMF